MKFLVTATSDHSDPEKRKIEEIETLEQLLNFVYGQEVIIKTNRPWPSDSDELKAVEWELEIYDDYRE